MENETSVEIDRSIGEVFEYTLNNLSEWSMTCIEGEVIEERPEGVGSTLRVVTRHEPPTLSAVHLEGRQFDIDVLYTFGDLSGRAG